MSGEDGICRFTRQLLAALRRARLENNRMPLLRAGNIKRTLNGEILTFMVKPMQLGRIEENAGFLISYKSIVLP